MAKLLEFTADTLISKMETDYLLNIEKLEKKMGYGFMDKKLIKRALTRRSFAKEHDLSGNDHMDALATLGDAVLDVIILSRMIDRGEYDKGVLSTDKMDTVNMSRLRQHAEDLRLEQFVRWGKGEASNHVWTSGRVLAECLESLVGAIYLDGEMEAARNFLITICLPSKDFWYD